MRVRPRISRTATPSQRLPSRDQRVTQWKSASTRVRGSAWNCGPSKLSAGSINPENVSRHCATSIGCGSPASSTGHLRVRDWPGGTR
jgi:hypothetical protein